MSTLMKSLIVSPPGARGVQWFHTALTQVGFDSEVLSVDELKERRLTTTLLSQKYRVVVLPGGNTYHSALGGGRILAIQLKMGLGWDLKQFAESGGLVLGVGTGFEALNHMRVFGDDFGFVPQRKMDWSHEWVRMTPFGGRSLWLRGIGNFELPQYQKESLFVIDPASYVEAMGRLDRLQMACLRLESTTGNSRIVGLCDTTGRILGLLPHPEFFLSWTQSKDWTMNPSRAASPGSGFLIFENAMKAVEL